MARVVAMAGDTLELLVFRTLGRQDHDALTATLDANNGLADHGLFLPAGVHVEVPDMPVDAPTEQLHRVQELWD